MRILEKKHKQEHNQQQQQKSINTTDFSTESKYYFFVVVVVVVAAKYISEFLKNPVFILTEFVLGLNNRTILIRKNKKCDIQHLNA